VGEEGGGGGGGERESQGSFSLKYEKNIKHWTTEPCFVNLTSYLLSSNDLMSF
jgi:hypothetical protein